jgi:excisionase family DNA binding protein
MVEGAMMIQKGLDRRMLTTEDVSKWLGMATRTVCLWAECGELPATKIGRQWRFYRDEIESWLVNQKPKSQHLRPD